MSVDARESMALASLLAGMAVATAGTAIVHALQYPVSAATPVLDQGFLVLDRPFDDLLKEESRR